MKDYPTADAMQDISRAKHGVASQVNIVVSRSRENTRIQNQKLKRAQKQLDQVEAQLGEFRETP